MEDLPLDVFTQLLVENPQLSITDVQQMCKTNKAFARACKEKHIWNRIFEREFPGELEQAEKDFPTFHWTDELARLLAFRFVLRMKIPEITPAGNINPSFVYFHNMDNNGVYIGWRENIFINASVHISTTHFRFKPSNTLHARTWRRIFEQVAQRHSDLFHIYSRVSSIGNKNLYLESTGEVTEEHRNVFRREIIYALFKLRFFPKEKDERQLLLYQQYLGTLIE